MGVRGADSGLILLNGQTVAQPVCKGNWASPRGLSCRHAPEMAMLGHHFWVSYSTFQLAICKTYLNDMETERNRHAEKGVVRLLVGALSACDNQSSALPKPGAWNSNQAFPRGDRDPSSAVRGVR